MYREWEPEPEMRGRLACLWSRTVDATGVARIVPDGCVDLIWGPGAPHVAGPDTGPHLTPLRPGDTYFGIRFRPGGLGGVLGVPASALRDLRVPLADLPVLRGITAEGMRDALAVRLRATAEPDRAGPAIARALLDGASVADVAWDLGLSGRQLHRRCLDAFGYGPKALQRVLRFRRALGLARSGVRLADVAAEAGYADQAHLANEVRRLAGVPMSELVPSASQGAGALGRSR
jgi:AraC-like DNA-binding protein